MKKQTKTNKLKEYALMCDVFSHLVKKNMAFCYLEDGRLITREYAKQYIADNHAYVISNE